MLSSVIKHINYLHGLLSHTLSSSLLQLRLLIICGPAVTFVTLSTFLIKFETSSIGHLQNSHKCVPALLLDDISLLIGWFVLH